MLHTFQTYFHGFEAEIFQHRYALALLVFALAAIVVALWALSTRKRYIVLQHSDESDMLMAQLGRIAAALERLNARGDVPNFTSDEILRPQTAEERVEYPAADSIQARDHLARVEDHVAPPPLTQVGVGSMFSFARRQHLPNPLYRPKR